jgi:hypothetical protein
MAMPDGAAIFITSGPWEAYSTPSRDLRLLIAMDTVRNFPKRVKKLPKRFILAPGVTPDGAADELRELLKAESLKRTFTYRRSDGSSHKLTMADVMDREIAFQMAYNPNDCIERRWGAPPSSPEASTCVGSAPDGHRQRMETYRSWFKDRVRPVD